AIGLLGCRARGRTRAAWGSRPALGWAARARPPKVWRVGGGQSLSATPGLRAGWPTTPARAGPSGAASIGAPALAGCGWRKEVT
nr:hypothetical protein [Tanacetum cinerariifolium]